MHSDEPQRHRRHGRHRHDGDDGDAVFVRMRHGRRGGPFGPDFGGFGPGFGGPGGPRGFGGPGGGRGRGRRRRGDVRVALLLLLAEEPRNGYGLMQILEERSDGTWRPSPGSVYPALQQLEDEGLIRGAQGDTGRTFEITEAGREQLAQRGEQKPPWEDDEDDDTRDAWRSFRHAIGSTAKAAAQVAQEGDPDKIAQAVELLKETRRGLYRILAEDSEA